MGGGPCPPLLGGRRAGGRRATFGRLADVESVRHRPLFSEPAVLDPPELVLGPVTARCWRRWPPPRRGAPGSCRCAWAPLCWPPPACSTGAGRPRIGRTAWP